MSPPTYLKCSKNKRSSGVYYVVVPVPTDKREALGCRTLERSLRTRDERDALRLRHAVVAEFMAQIEKAGKEPQGTPADALLALAERTAKSVDRQDFLNFEGATDAYIERRPQMPPEEVAKVRRASAIAYGTGADLLDKLAETWLKAEQSKGLMAATVKDKAAQLGHLLRFVGPDARPSALTKALAVDYVEQCLNPMDVSKGRKRLLLQSATAFADWLELRGKIAANPFLKVGRALRGDAKPRAERRAFTDAEVYRLIVKVKARTEERAKVRTKNQEPLMPHLVALMLFTGARPQELTDIRADGVDDQSMHIPDSKTPNGVRLVPIHPTIAPLVAKLKASSADGYLLSGLIDKDGDRYRAIGTNLRRLVKHEFKDPRLVPYCTRRTVVTQLEAAGVSPWVQDHVIGHETDEAITRAKRSTREDHYLDDPGFVKKAEALGIVTYGDGVAKLVESLAVS